MQRSRFNIMTRLVGLVKPLTGHMVLAVMMGVLGHLCASFITVFGGYAVLSILRPEQPSNIRVLFASVLIFALIRGFLRYAEQACNHFIAFKLLALIRDKVFGALRRLCPAKLEGKDKGNLISVITSDIGMLSDFVLDSLRGLPEIIQYGQGKKRLEEMDLQTRQLSEDEAHMKRTAGYNTAITNTVILLFDLVMLFLSAKLIGFEGCLIVTLTLMSSFGPVVALASLGATLQSTFAAGDRVLNILEENPVAEEITGKEETFFHGAGAENITFAYEDEIILNNFSVTIPENSLIGINGRSGSGKSTLLRLFMRFWPVRQGAVKISGKNIEEINTSDLRGMESFVTQETHLFHDSIRNNLRIAKLDATDEEIIAACKKASVHDFISGLEKGYDTKVGELGDTLSGGERQRLGLARAFLHDAPFMLLDEPTSNLDSLNEAVILKSLSEECSNKSVILVSHRKSTMGIADIVYTVEHGRVS